MSMQGLDLGDVLVLGPDLLRRRVGFEDLIEPVADALVRFSRGEGESSAVVFAPRGREGDVHVKSAWLPGHALFTVKVATAFADATGGVMSGGMIAAFDARTGALRALLRDDHHLSDVRTAAAGALLARHLARSSSRVVGVIGTGVQAYLQVLAALHVLPAVDRVLVWGRDPGRASRLRDALMRRNAALHVASVDGPEHAVRRSDVVITATASRTPIVMREWLRPGTHVSAVGADDASKCEIEPRAWSLADRIVVDSRTLTRQFGDLHRALCEGTLDGATRFDELGDVIAGRVSGRREDDEITIGKLVGLGVQDLAATGFAIDSARAVGTGHRRACANDLEPACARDA